MRTVVRTGIETDTGDGSWADAECGCRHTIATDGELCVITCDDHRTEHAIAEAKEVYDL
jgi:hypothetical protein